MHVAHSPGLPSSLQPFAKNLFESDRPFTVAEPIGAAAAKREPLFEALGASLGELSLESDLVKAFRFSASESSFAVAQEGIRAKGFTRTLEFDAVIEQGDQLLAVELKVTQSVVAVSIGSGVNDSAFGELFDRLRERLSEATQDILDRFERGTPTPDFFSPEATANRIADFALTGFDSFEAGLARQEDTPDARQRFVDYILPAIERGFREALDILGNLPEDILANVEQTRNLVDDRLSAFVASD